MRRASELWLDIYCPGRRTSRAIDIHTLDRHPLASVGSLVLGLYALVSGQHTDADDLPGCSCGPHKAAFVTLYCVRHREAFEDLCCAVLRLSPPRRPFVLA
jgi:hypothetical protein